MIKKFQILLYIFYNKQICELQYCFNVIYNIIKSIEYVLMSGALHIVKVLKAPETAKLNSWTNTIGRKRIVRRLADYVVQEIMSYY